MSLADRLTAAMAASGINQADLARACKVKPPSVHGWLSGKAKFLRGENLLRAAAALGVNQQWLATGDGPMHPNEAPRENSVSGNGSDVIQNVTDGPGIHGPYPLISEVQAGMWTEIYDNFHAGEAEEWLSSAKNLGENGYLLRVRGKSMYAPGERFSFPEGMILHVNPSLDPVPGQFVIVRREAATSATFKRYVLIDSTPYLEAINPNWPPEEKYLKLQKGDVWCGVVVDASIGGLP